MVAGALLPVAIHKNKLYFLFGKENPMEDSSVGWSDFGGGCENAETPFDTALREGGEELTGFLGDKNDLIKKVPQSCGIYELTMDTYHSFLFLMDYDDRLPTYYNDNHRFLWNRMDKHMLNDSKLFEKIEIQWFCETELREKKKEFREFYQKMIDKIIDQMPKIRKHFMRCSKRKHTRRTKTTKRSMTTRRKYKMRGG
jgi:hypothetical protein